MGRQDILDLLKGGLIVSCQMEEHAPCYSDDIVELMAKAAIWAGACGLRINGADNVRKMKSMFDVPVIGLVKVHREDTEVFMTPSMKEVDALVEAKADIIAVDGTDRLIDGRRACDQIPQLKERYPEMVIFADVRDEKDAVRALDLGADIVAPTFYRFKKDAKSTDLPDWEMFARMCRECRGKGTVMMEGKIWTPDDAIRALHYGAHAVIVGSAITRPHLIARRFVDHIQGFSEKRSLLY